MPKTDDLPINLSGIIWCSVLDSNQRLPLCKSGILSTELTEHMVEVKRVELLSEPSVHKQFLTRFK